MHEEKITPLMQAQSTTKTSRTYRSREEWEQLISAWGQSGQSQKAFCESKGLCYRNFCQWKSRLKQDVQETQADSASFLPIQVTEKRAGTPKGLQAATANLPNGIKLSLEGDVQTLAALIKALSVSSC